MSEDDDLAGEALFRSLDDASWTARAKSGERIAALFCQGRLTGAARRQAEEAFRQLRYDSDLVVRRLLAECLKDAAGVPHDIASGLATDHAEVAVPFLQSSPALGDRDLLHVLRDHPGPHRCAIARRRALSDTVAEALCRCGEEAAVMAVLANDGAAIGAATLRWLLDSKGNWPALREAIARRRLVPIDIGERMPGPPLEAAAAAGRDLAAM